MITFTKKYITTLLLLFWISSILSAQEIIKNGNSLYLSNTLIIRTKGPLVNKVLNKSTTSENIISIERLFPSSETLSKNGTRISLDDIYIVEYASNEDPMDIADRFIDDQNILWAEPKYVYKTCYSPNDSLFKNNMQEYLLQVNALSAWEKTKGDTNIIIAIVDSGVDWLHPDLSANIYKVNNKLIPGSDFGGLIGIGDDDPMEDINYAGKYHGTLVAGLASAVTDNKIGTASVGFNCSILPVKVSRDDSRDENGNSYIVYGFKGIKWAADNGAKVINCSWGGNDYSDLGQSVIDYAIAKGAVIVAAQGNNSSDENFYPANYEGVLSVGWLETGEDVKTVNSNANYGKNVKVFAPGSGIISTWQRRDIFGDAVYKAEGGSSISAPIVSGLAGLVISQFPFYTPRQVVERIRVTSDYIDDYNSNKYKYLLGHGLINANRAVDKDFYAISVVVDSIEFLDTGNGDGIFESNEEVIIQIYFKNYLSPVDNIKASLVPLDNYVEIVSGEVNSGQLNTFDEFSNEFRIKVASNAPYNYKLKLLLKYGDGNKYEDFKVVDLFINNYDVLPFIVHKTNKLKLTINSIGNLAYTDFPHNYQGEGFTFLDSENLLNEGGFLYGTSKEQVMNSIRIKELQDSDFVQINNVLSSGYYKDECKSWANFNDLGARENTIGLKTVLTAYSRSNDNYIILNMKLVNTKHHDINNLYAGYFFDWNLSKNNFTIDTTYFDKKNKIGIAYNKSDKTLPYVGVALISDNENFGYYPISNNSKLDKIIFNDEDGFSDDEKWYSLTQGLNKTEGDKGDVSMVISGGPYELTAARKNREKSIIFSIAAGSSLEEVIDAINESRELYGTNLEVETLTHETSKIKLSINNIGNLAFNDFPCNSFGDGFTFMDSENLLNEGGLIYGTSSEKIMNAIRIKEFSDSDFVRNSEMKSYLNNNEYKSISYFNDSGAGDNALGLTTVLTAYSLYNNNFVVINVELQNKTSSDINNFYAGYFFDWNLSVNNFTTDTTYFDMKNKMGIAYNKFDNTLPYVGAALISDAENFGYYPINNKSELDEIILNDENGFSDAEKWYSLTRGLNRNEGTKGDISMVISGGPYDIPAYDKINIIFSIAADSSVEGLTAAINESRNLYGVNIKSEPTINDSKLFQNYPNPFNTRTILNYQLFSDNHITLEIYDILGRKVGTLINEFQEKGLHSITFNADQYQLSTGVYFYCLKTGSLSRTKKMLLLK